MPARPIGLYLRDFSVPLRTVPAGPEDGAGADMAAVHADAFEQGRAQGEAEMRRLFEAQIEAERERHRGEIEALRAEHAAALSGDIAEGLAKLEAGLKDALSREVAAVLAPLVQKTVSDATVAELAGLVSDCLRAPDAGRISVKGSRLLYDGLCAALGERADTLDFVEDDRIDLLVEIDGTILRSRLAELATQIAEALS